MPDRDPLDVEQEGQALLMALFRLVRCMRVQGPEEVIDLVAMYVLQSIASTPGIRVSELADRLALDASTLSRLTRSLEQLGYLDRRPDPADKRASQMHISQGGQAVMSQALQWRTAMIASAFEGWSTKERVRFVELGTKFATDFEKAVAR